MSRLARTGPALLRLAVPALALALSWQVLSQVVAGAGWAGVAQHLAALTPARAAAALVLVALAFLAVAGQERAVMAHLALEVPVPRARLASAVSAAVSQATGFGPVVGALVRHRMLPGLSLRLSAAISLGVTAGFFSGLAWLSLLWAALAGRGGAPGLFVAVTLLGAAAALAPGARLFGRRKPNLLVAGRFLGWLAVDLAALCGVLWVVMPAAPPLPQMLPVFLLALGAGMVSGSPGGIGPFEAGLALGLPQAGPDALVAGVVLFRLMATALPAVLGLAVLLAAGRRAAGLPGIVPVCRPVLPGGAALARLPMAEAQLVRQGGLQLIAPGDGSGDGSREGPGNGPLWLSGALPHARVVLGGPACGRRPASRALSRLRRAAAAEGRVPCLYKAGARLAVLARRAGFHVLPVAREAVLDPVTFTTAGHARAALRRKLARARKAGVTVAACRRPPLHEMETVARAWRRAHGRERGFSTGVWVPGTVTAQRLFTARGDDGRLLAFVTFHAAPGEWVLDLVRYRPGLPDGTMYLLVQSAIAAAAAADIRRLTLAAVPEVAFRRNVWPPLALLFGRRRVAGLLQFKAAFAPRWERRYIAAPGRAALLLAAADIGLAVLFPRTVAPPVPGGGVVVALPGRRPVTGAVLRRAA